MRTLDLTQLCLLPWSSNEGPLEFRHVRSTVCREEVAPPADGKQMAEEIGALAPSQQLVHAGRYRVGVASASQIPTLLGEIGRLREVSFRAAGEGTGRALDLDAYDDWYLHLFLWDDETSSLIGAYRLGVTDVILARQGNQGLYTQSLFHYTPDFFDRFGLGLELGRSFVCPAFQRSPRALALLWRGIGQLVAAMPRYSKLFGPVSVSQYYSEYSRQLVAHCLLAPARRHELAHLVQPLRPPGRALLDADTGVRDLDLDVKRLHRRVTELESECRGLPILLREYVKLGGRFLGFSIDPDFGNAMDGLVALDLHETEPRLLQLYMGTEAYERFSPPAIPKNAPLLTSHELPL